MPRERAFESVAGREDDRVRAVGRRHAPLSVGPGHAMRGELAAAPDPRANGNRRSPARGCPGSAASPAEPLQVRRGSTAIRGRRGPRLLQEIALGVDIHEDEGSFQHRGRLRSPGIDPGRDVI